MMKDDVGAGATRMADLKVGQQIMDNDPRMRLRVLTITEILPNGVAAKDCMGRVFTYLRRRIYTDGKQRRSGFTLLRLPDGVVCSRGCPAKEVCKAIRSGGECAGQGEKRG